MKITEISGIFENGMWSYGSPFPAVEIKPVSSIDKEGVSVHSIFLSTISGTYLETGAHLFKNEITVDQIPLEKLVVDATIIKLTKDKNEREHITVKDLEQYPVDIKAGDALLIHTGWDRMWNKKNFVLDSPHFTKESMEWILSKNISILGADLPCYDDPQAGSLTTELSLLEKMFKKGALVLAPLVNLASISKTRAKLVVLPLHIKDVSGAPCRAIVIED
ncbi:MAG: cyclase family protein [Elusimicrobia bacterium]|nr:cyclase family protein [Elusimicrobiota bacterium]